MIPSMLMLRYSSSDTDSVLGDGEITVDGLLPVGKLTVSASS